MNQAIDFNLSPERKVKKKSGRGRGHWVNAAGLLNEDFRCANCGQYVSADPLLCGVKNRNHCPYCLYSRHLDWFEAGDRLSPCKAPMRPVGLTLKRTQKKYAPVNGGELMLVHQCVECGEVSINRIAADDIPDFVIEVYRDSLTMDAQLKDRLKEAGIEILDAGDAWLVEAQLLGRADSAQGVPELAVAA